MRVIEKMYRAIDKVCFEVEHLGIKYIIKRTCFRAIFEIRHLWVKKRITKGVMRKIREKNKNPH